jgi:uncharacterized membrane protein YfcA
MPERRTPQWYRFGGAVWALVAAAYWIAELVQPKPLHLVLGILFTCTAIVCLARAKEFARRSAARRANRWKLPDA